MPQSLHTSNHTVPLLAGMYSAVPFGLAQVLVEIPYIALQAILYGTITYALICFEWTAAKFFWYLLFTLLTILFFTYYGQMSVAISPNPQLAAILGSAVYSVWFLLAGGSVSGLHVLLVSSVGGGAEEGQEVSCLVTVAVHDFKSWCICHTRPCMHHDSVQTITGSTDPRSICIGWTMSSRVGYPDKVT